VELLQSREIQLQQFFSDRDTTYNADRSKLIQKKGTVFADAGTTGWGLDDDSDEAGAYQTQHMSIADLQQQQQRMVQGLYSLFCLVL
jgi:hypothetical protein